MQDTQLYQQILGLSEPWFVASVDLNVSDHRVDVGVEHRSDARGCCPRCGEAAPLHDHREPRTWRHLDTCQFQTHLHACPPRVNCLAIDYHHVGYEAAALLDRLMDGEPAEGRTVLVPPSGIIVRESTDYFAVEDEVVAAALRFVAGRLRENLNVERVADEVAVSPSTLQRRFAEALGRGVGDEIRRLRLELAKRLLRDERKQISQVAREAGFGSRVTMNYVFNRELGLSPTAFRDRELGR